MSEEANEVVEETSLENTETVNIEDVLPEYTEVELEAIDKGWNPEGVDGKRNLTAEEFLDRQPLYDKMHKLEKRLKEQDKKFEAMQQHEKMVRDRMHQEHLKELKSAKRAAMEDMDYDRADQIDDEIYAAKKEYDEVSKPVQQAPVENIQEVVEEWASRNPWYEEDRKMKRFADGEGADYKRDNPDADIHEILDHISKEVKKEFPEKFQNMRRNSPSSVEGSATGGRRVPATAKQKTVRDLPEEARDVMRTLVRAGAFKTEQDYVNDYFNQK